MKMRVGPQEAKGIASTSNSEPRASGSSFKVHARLPSEKKRFKSILSRIPLLLILMGMGCAQAQSEAMSDRYNFEAKPILPVRLWTEWITPRLEETRVPGLQAGNIFEATIDRIHIDGVSPRKNLFFALRPNFNNEIFVRIQLPAPTEEWMPFGEGDSVIVQIVDAPTQGKKKARINVSIVRVTDGSAIHVLEGQSTLPEPFPEALSLVPRMSRLGQVAEGDRRFCARVYERHPMEMRRDGYDPVRLLPGQPMEFELGRDVDGWVEVRDCLSASEGTCPKDLSDEWLCQALVALRPGDEPQTSLALEP